MEAVLGQLEALALKHFSIQTLRPQQREVFKGLLSKDQLLVTLPTGAGKTLIYALGSQLFPEGMTVVVCPLIALMRDQYLRMTQAGIPAAIICSEQSEDERRSAYKSLMSGQVRLLFVSPERLALLSFQRFLKRFLIRMVVVDEAHCVVSWGHSFRPEYAQLASILRGLNIRKVLALTATASKSSRRLIREMLFPDPGSVTEIVDRPLRENIGVSAVRVYSEEERWTVVRGLVTSSDSRKTILYFPRREQCQNAAQELKKCGLNAVVYHAGLQRDVRRSVEEYLRQSARPVVICATLAFGMGIDLPDVQLIVVVGFPGNIEELFQMMGRAGRQGEKAKAMIVWSGSDPKRRSFQFDKMLPEPGVLLEQFRAMAHFFPGSGQARLVPRHDLKKVLQSFHKNERDVDQAAENISGILQMLGCGGGQSSANSDLVKLEIKHIESISVLTSQLPPGPSRRRMVLEWIGQRFNPSNQSKGIVFAVFSLSEMLEDLQLAWEKVFEVLRYYSERSELSFQIISQEDARASLLFGGSLAELMQQFDRYTRLRSALGQSLQALSSFVLADQCRMQFANSFFTGRPTGASLSARMQCGQCDLCESRATKRMRHSAARDDGALTLTLPDHL
ncbi:MAG: ATP-dependent DNA helicase RecQ [Betaproteobacteria bacterium]|nr:ATP-dependent DNA helicase RecQ [Betaproteobacteria bacterium]